MGFTTEVTCCNPPPPPPPFLCASKMAGTLWIIPSCFGRQTISPHPTWVYMIPAWASVRACITYIYVVDHSIKLYSLYNIHRFGGTSSEMITVSLVPCRVGSLLTPPFGQKKQLLTSQSGARPGMTSSPQQPISFKWRFNMCPCSTISPSKVITLSSQRFSLWNN